jgi:putative FmdB family regulatory protein
MPIYTYACPACNSGYDKIVKIDDRDDQFCENCGYRLIRSIDSPGMVWSPTRNGGFSL